MELKFEKVFNEIQELIENHCTDEDLAYDLFDKLIEYDYQANCNDNDLFKLIKSDEKFNNEIVKFYKLSKRIKND